MAWLYAIGLLVLGFVLVLLEIFVIPGFNIFGVIGFLTICTGVGYAYLSMGLAQAVQVAGLGVAGTVFLVRSLVRSQAWRRLVLESDVSRSQGYDSIEPGREILLGRRGEVVTTLRPVGRVRFEKRTIDAVSEGGIVAVGELVEVRAVEGNKVVVHRVADDLLDASPSKDDA